jgi:hypothetical protein
MDYLGDIGAVHLETYAEYDVQSRIWRLLSYM